LPRIAVACSLAAFQKDIRMTKQDTSSASRRALLAGSAGVAAAAAAVSAVSAAPRHKTAHATTASQGSYVTTKDGVQIYYKDWGSGQPIVFSHGWPLSADDWDTQMMFFLNHGYRVVAHDRRGHGRSSQVGDGHDMDHYADDLAAVVQHLDLHDAVHVGHSTGGGEVVHYLARHGESRAAKAAKRRASKRLREKLLIASAACARNCSSFQSRGATPITSPCSGSRPSISRL